MIARVWKYLIVFFSKIMLVIREGVSILQINKQRISPLQNLNFPKIKLKIKEGQ